MSILEGFPIPTKRGSLAAMRHAVNEASAVVEAGRVRALMVIAIDHDGSVIRIVERAEGDNVAELALQGAAIAPISCAE